MKLSYWLWLGAAAVGVGSCVLASGCDSGSVKTPKQMTDEQTYWLYESPSIERILDPDFGVVCYRKKGFEGISCVQISLPDPAKADL